MAKGSNTASRLLRFPRKRAFASAFHSSAAGRSVSNEVFAKILPFLRQFVQDRFEISQRRTRALNQLRQAVQGGGSEDDLKRLIREFDGADADFQPNQEKFPFDAFPMHRMGLFLCPGVYPTSSICRSIRLVCVGPVTIRSPVALRKFEESFSRRNCWGIKPSSMAREHVKGSTSPPAALVGPSVPSVATLAKQVWPENGRSFVPKKRRIEMK